MKPHIGLAVILLVTLGFAVPAAAETPEYLIFSGELRDEAGSVVSGVYPLQFSLHRSEASRRRAWSEQLFVAVEDGVYTVELGRSRDLPKNVEIGTSFMAVSIPGGPEIARVPLTERNLPTFHEATAPEAAPTGDPATPGAAAAGRVAFAERAGVAYESELARNCERLENLTLAQVEDRIQKKVGSGVRVGSATRSTGSAGGTGGRHYRLVCPRGYVAVGIEGGAGIYVDSLEVICAPLE